ncbi:unnamed protein product [Blepharisma stoltei]|uniref:Uncharacterized protein n=1 Tax=Blepharisma stoltei TaxID=1481888 RepID=A0AAU9JR37_9CILI|nr:unnamed protein product [Blepharisma stoltei]
MFRLFRKFSDIAQKPLRDRILEAPTSALLSTINSPEATSVDLVFGLKELSDRIRKHNLSRKVLAEPKYHEIQLKISRDIMNLDKDSVLSYSYFLKTYDKLTEKEFTLASERWLATKIRKIANENGFTVKELGELAENLLSINKYIYEIESSAASQNDGTLEDFMKILKVARILNKEPDYDFWNKFTEFFDHMDYENMSPKEIFEKLNILYSQPDIYRKKICQITDKAFSSLLSKLDSLDFPQILKILEYYTLQANLDENIYLSFISKLEEILQNPPYIIKSEQTFNLISLIADISKQKDYPVVPSLKNALLNDIKLKLDSKALHLSQYKPLVHDIMKIEKVISKDLSLSLLNYIKTSQFIGIWTFECIRLFEKLGIGEYTDGFIADAKEAIKAISKLDWVDKFSIIDVILQIDGYDFKPGCFDCFRSIKTELHYVSGNNSYEVLDAYLQAELSRKTQLNLMPEIEKIVRTLNAVNDPLSDPLVLKHLLMLGGLKSELPKELLGSLASRMPLSDIEKVLAVDYPVFTAKSVLMLFKEIKDRIDDRILVHGMKYLSTTFDYMDWVDYSYAALIVDQKFFLSPLFDKYYEKFFNELTKCVFPTQYSRMYRIWGFVINEIGDINELKSKKIRKMIELLAFAQKIPANLALKLHKYFINQQKDYSSTILLINLALKQDNLTEEERKRVLNQFFSISENISFDELKTKVLTYNITELSDKNKEEAFILKLQEKIRDLSPRYMYSVFDLLGQLYFKVLHAHYDFSNNIVNAFADYVTKHSNKCGSKLLTKAFWSFAKHNNKSPDLYKVLLSELGKNYYDLNPLSKVNILASFGKKGLRVKDVYEIICNDILQNVDDYIASTSEILTSIGEVNYENEEWSQKLTRIFLDKYDFSAKQYSNYWYYNLLWALVKSKASEDDINRLISYAKEGFHHYGKKGIKQFWLYYHFKNSNPALSEQSFRISQEKINWQTVYGVRVDWLNPVVDAFESVGIKADRFEKLEEITSPLLIKEKKLCLWAKNPYIMTYENEMLRGDFMFVKECIEKRGGRVQLLDLEALKGLDNKKIVKLFEAQGILS